MSPDAMRFGVRAVALATLALGVPFVGCGGTDSGGTASPETDAGAGDSPDVVVSPPSAQCGNKRVELGEDCDDGNRDNGDGCENDCSFTCAKGTVNGDARCDDKDPCNGKETCGDDHKCAKGTPQGDNTPCADGKVCLGGACKPGVCGDGIVTAPEECDDGNATDGDGCDACKLTCTTADPSRSCKSSDPCVGDGTCNDTTHTCAPGKAATDGTSCGTGKICKASVCVAAACGDGIVTPPEVCDDGNKVDGDGCDGDCTFSCAAPAADCPAPPACNVAVCTAAHVCATAPNPQANGTACGTNLVCKDGACIAPDATCGNGVVEKGEDCDFGAGNGPGTGCEATCRFSCAADAACNDGNACNGVETCTAVTVSGHAGKKCAAGSAPADGTSCGAGNICRGGTCKASTCGDGYVDASKGETCDPPASGTCDAQCHRIVCGDGVRSETEQCDDGNTTNLDGCSATCRFEQAQRANGLAMQFGTDAYCGANALGGAIGQVARSQIQAPLDTGVKNGDISVLFPFLGIGDLSGTSGDVTLGSVTGKPVAASGYDGNSDLDWWYTVDAASVDASRMPLSSLPGRFDAKVLTAGPGRLALTISLSGSPAALRLSNARLKVDIGGVTAPLTSSGATPGHLASEHLDPALQSFATAGVGNKNAPTGELCGNVSASSLATVAIPDALLNGATKCSENYAAGTNTLLDAIVGGCKVVLGITALSPTQPDQVDPSVSLPGTAPYKLVPNASKHVDSCIDKNKQPVPLATCLDGAAYSAFFKFSTDRVILK